MDNEIINIENIPISPTKDDLPDIKILCYYFWEDEGIYSENYYELLLQQNLSFIIRDKNYELTAVCLAEYEEDKKQICIAVLCVRKEDQRKGLGKLILEHCINNCIKKGYNDFYLHVCVTNHSAIKLYEKLGFYKKGLIKNYYSNDPPPNNDAYLMELNKNKKIENNKIKNENNNNNENIICIQANLTLIIIIGIIIGIEFIIIFSE